MLGVSTKFHQAFKESDREIYVKIHINGTTYSADKIKSMEYSSGALGGESFQIGSTQSAALKITFTEIIEGLKELDTVTVELGIKIKGSGLPSNIENVSRIGRAKVGRARLVTFVPDRYEFVPLGTFYISDRVDPNRNEGTTTLEARDGFIFMEGAYESKLSYPTRLANVAIEIANKSGITIDPVSFNHLSTYTISKPEGYTYRQAIGLIGQYEAGFVCFDRNGKLAIRQLTDPKFFIAPSEYFLKGLTKNELLFQPKGISCKVIKKKDGSSNETITLQAGSTNGPQITIENNTMTQSLLEQIFTKVKNLNYYPIDLKWRGNPALEVGDWVTMTDRMGKNFKTPILNYTLVFDGGLTSTISADSKSQSGSVTAFKGPLQQKLEEIDYRLDAAGKNNVYSGTAKPKNPQEGDIWFKKNGPDDEIWVYQKLEDGSFDWVMTTSTRMADEIKEQIENATPSDEIVKTINLSPEMDGKEWLKISGAKLWLTNETKIDKAIITSAMIAEVDAGKIRTGTLDASQITVTNLNANSISTGTIRGIDIFGVKITGSTITSESGNDRITMSGASISTYYGNILRSKMSPTSFFVNDLNGVEMMNLSSRGLSINKIGSTNQLGYLGRGTDNATKREELAFNVDYGNVGVMAVQDTSLGYYIRRLAVSSAGLHASNIIMGGNYVGGSREIKDALLKDAGALGKFEVYNNVLLNFYSNLNMNGWSILNNSDIRLKENIEKTDIDGISETKKLDFYEFYRKQHYQFRDDKKQPSRKRELGLIAQYSPFLSVEDSEDHYQSIDTNKQIMLNSLTNKQLIKLVEEHEKRIVLLEKKLYGN